MKYIIMCGGKYAYRKQLTMINGECLVARTIRLLQECSVKDIAISSNDSIFEQFNVPVLHHENRFKANVPNGGYWVDAFYPMNSPVCYLFGDVLYSPEAIRTIVQTKVEDVMLFASAPPFTKDYIKPWAEPFAFKVTNTHHFKDSVHLCKKWQDIGLFNRVPIAWELWQVLKDTQLNVIDYKNYVIINDYTCDIDCEADLHLFEERGVDV